LSKQTAGLEKYLSLYHYVSKLNARIQSENSTGTVYVQIQNTCKHKKDDA